MLHFMKSFLILMALATHAYGSCFECIHNLRAACVSENQYAPCIDGNIVLTSIKTCPSTMVCYHGECVTAATPNCEVCHVCNAPDGHACSSMYSYHRCNNGYPAGEQSECPNGFVCDPFNQSSDPCIKEGASIHGIHCPIGGATDTEPFPQPEVTTAGVSTISWENITAPVLSTTAPTLPCPNSQFCKSLKRVRELLCDEEH